MFKLNKKSKNPKITVVNAEVLSFSGTTWVNLSLSSHPDAFMIGPPARLWTTKDNNFEKACRVHPQGCDFWDGFNTHWDRKENFFVALSEYSGKTVFFMDTASPDFIKETTSHPEVRVVRNLYLRDLRAVTASYWRKNSDKTYLETISPGGWINAASQYFPKQSDFDTYSAVLRYEDTIQDPLKALQTAGAPLGMEYDESSLRFWEWDHHITSGSAGPINMIRIHHGANISKWRDFELYNAQLEKMKANPGQPFKDDRWKKELSRQDLYNFDQQLGTFNARLGYDRDTFTDAEIADFSS